MTFIKPILRPIRQLRQTVLRSIYTWRVQIECRSCKGKLKVNLPAKVNGNTELGYNVSMNGFYISGQGRVVIGDNFHCGVQCRLITQNHNYNGTLLPYDETLIIKDIIIEDNVWLGDMIIILAGVTIGEGAIIQAGSVVVSDIPKCAIAGGHPAKVFKYRDLEHYERLKREGKFLV